MRTSVTAAALLAAIALAACSRDEAEAPAEPAEPVALPGENAAEGEDAPETVSILRPDIDTPQDPVVPLDPLTLTIGFSKGGSELDDAALENLRELLGSPQVGRDGEIILRGHSDTGGTERVNMRVSRERAERVRDWLVENGIEADRITIIAFGEQNPRRPNALPDGTPNEKGRAANRRVEIEVPVARDAADGATADSENANDAAF